MIDAQRRETLSLLEDTALRVFAGTTGIFAADWAMAEAAGLPFALADDVAGGSGGGYAEARAILYAAGRHAVALPIAEALLAGKLLGAAGMPLSGPLTLALSAEGTLADDAFTGTLTRVCQASDCGQIVIVHDGQAILLARTEGEIVAEHRDAAGQLFADLHFPGAKVLATAQTNLGRAALQQVMGFLRACQIGGAIDAALALSIQHVMQREQFGRPLAKFQAIQQQMALFAEEAAACNAAAMAAAEAADAGQADFALTACALRAGRAAGEAASIAHQVHGAIGFTEEYALQRFTRRLWAWRSECGNERALSRALGERAARAGADGYWAALAAGFPV